MTPTQIDLARHALGLAAGRTRSYRNHFVTGPGSTDYEEWTVMVARGDAQMRPGSPLSGGDPIFLLTLQGASAALRIGEVLDPKHFPGACS